MLSTTFEAFKHVRLPAALACTGMLAVCMTAWNGSTSAGGSYDTEISAVIRDVAQSTPMAPLCRVIGRKLAETSVKAKVTVMRPTQPWWDKREREATAAWEAAKCPTAALVGIAYGASNIANWNIRNRYLRARRG